MKPLWIALATVFLVAVLPSVSSAQVTGTIDLISVGWLSLPLSELSVLLRQHNYPGISDHFLLMGMRVTLGRSTTSWPGPLDSLSGPFVSVAFRMDIASLARPHVVIDSIGYRGSDEVVTLVNAGQREVDLRADVAWLRDAWGEEIDTCSYKAKPELDATECHK